MSQKTEDIEHVLTVVIHYKEGADLPRKLTQEFADQKGAFDGCEITAVSREDEISRVEEFEENQW